MTEILNQIGPEETGEPNNTNNQPPKNKVKSIITVLAVILVLLAVGFGVYYLKVGGVNFKFDFWNKSDNQQNEQKESKKEISFVLADYSHLNYDQASLEKFFSDIKKAREIINKEPNNALVWLQLGLIYYSLQEWDLAQSAYQEALKIFPASGQALANLAEVYIYGYKDFNQAAEYLRQAIEFSPMSLSYYKTLADLYRSEFPEKKTEIEDIFLAGVKKNNAEKNFTVDAYVYLSDFFWDEGDIGKAVFYNQKALDLMPGEAGLKEHMAELKKDLELKQ